MIVTPMLNSTTANPSVRKKKVKDANHNSSSPAKTAIDNFRNNSEIYKNSKRAYGRSKTLNTRYATAYTTAKDKLAESAIKRNGCNAKEATLFSSFLKNFLKVSISLP